MKMTHGAVFHLLSLDFRDEVMKRLSGKRNVSFNLKKKSRSLFLIKPSKMSCKSNGDVSVL